MAEDEERHGPEREEPEETPREDEGNPWAKTSSGDADSVTDDD
jgi:hypothetical protein